MATAGPKGELTAFDLLVLVEEMNGVVGSYVDKALQPSDDEFVLRLRKPGTGSLELVVRNGRWLFLREKEASEGPPPLAFAMLVRKHLENRRLLSLEQVGFERIAVLGFDGYELVLELFGDGNIILVKDGAIVQPLRDRSWETREVRPGRPYVYPPARVDPRHFGVEEFSRTIRGSKGDLVRTLAVSLNLGGRYAEELCARTGLERGLKVGRLDDEKVHRLHGALGALFKEMGTARRPVLVLKGDAPVDFTPVPLMVHEGLEQRPFPTLNSLVASYTEYLGERCSAEASSNRTEAELHRLSRQLESQERAVNEYRERAAVERRAAEALLASVEGLSALLREVQAVKRAGGWEAVTRAIGQRKLPPEVVEASPPDGAVKVRLADAAGELEVLLDLRRTVRENASAGFSASKEAGEKARRTLELLDEVKSKMQKLESTGPERPQLTPSARARPRRKPEWFERFRWFLSSDGNIVVAGRDATSNDRLVKRHLKDGDAYSHADLHGAPSVVVKGTEGRAEGEAGIPERTLKEACQFALICSKAWAAGLASGSAYWAKPDQVSKTPESGEYLPKGAFMVRGRKNFYHDLEMRLAIGRVERGGQVILMGGPVSALSSRTGEFVVLEPGEDDHRTMARKVSERLGCTAEEVAPLLPPGRSRLSG